MDVITFNLIAIAAVFLVAFGIALIQIGKRIKTTDKKRLLMILIGWLLIVLPIIGLIIAFIVFINDSSGITGTYLFAFISPLFIFIGFAICLGIGISSLVEGYKKDQEGKTNTSAIIRGWSLLFLSIAVIAAVIITLAILFTNYSNSRSDTPVRFM